MIGVLPDDFLRLDTSVTATNTTNLNNSNNSLASSGSAANVGAAQGTNSKDFMTDDDVERFLEDEKLAIFLQNEEFLRELRRNREFVTSLEAGGDDFTYCAFIFNNNLVAMKSFTLFNVCCVRLICNNF